MPLPPLYVRQASRAVRAVRPLACVEGRAVTSFPVPGHWVPLALTIPHSHLQCQSADGSGKRE